MTRSPIPALATCRRRALPAALTLLCALAPLVAAAKPPPPPPPPPEVALVTALGELADVLAKHEPCGQAGRAMQRWLDRHLDELSDLIPQLRARVTLLTPEDQAALDADLAVVHAQLADFTLRCGHHPTVQAAFARFGALAAQAEAPTPDAPTPDAPTSDTTAPPDVSTDTAPKP